MDLTDKAKIQNYLIVVAGPTAIGKTSLSIRLARHFNTLILSSDSRQFFREMNIGTAKPAEAELARAPHYFINSKSIFDDYSVGNFEADALALLEKEFPHFNPIIMTGGSGLYVKAVCEGLDAFPEVPLSVRKEVEQEYQGKGIDPLQSELQRVDPEYFDEVDRQNPHRLIRAIAVFRASGKPFSSFRRGRKKQRPFQTVYVRLDIERERLYDRINQRVDGMMKAGLLEEVRTLYPHKKQTALQTVGYQELFAHLDGQCSLEEAVEKIKQNTRRYAKRQLTWLRKEIPAPVFQPDDFEGILNYIKREVY